MKRENTLVLDLHGYTKAEAEIYLENFFIYLKKENIKTAKIITGWGEAKEPVLFNFVKKWLIEKAYRFDNDLGSFFIYLNN